MEQREPHAEGGLSTKLLLALAISAGGGSAGVDAILAAIRPQGSAEVAGAINSLQRSMEEQNKLFATEIRELRRELVEVTQGMAVGETVDREHDRRIGKLETDRVRPHKN